MVVSVARMGIHSGMKHDAHVRRYRRLKVIEAATHMALAHIVFGTRLEPPRWTWKNRLAWLIFKLLGDR